VFLSLAFRLTNRGGSNHRENKQTLRRSRVFRDAIGARSYSELSLVYVTLTACRHACSGRDTRTIESPTARKLGPADYYVHTPVIIISASGGAAVQLPSTDTVLVMSGRQNAVEAAARTIAFCERSASLLATNLDGGGGGGFAV